MADFKIAKTETREGSIKYWQGPISESLELINKAWARIREIPLHEMNGFSLIVNNLNDEDKDGIVAITIKIDGQMEVIE